jgi:acetate kinase
MRVLVLNPGSSSLKSSVVESTSVPEVGADGRVPAIPAAGLAPLARASLDWGVDATEGTDPEGDIRRLLARYKEAGVPVGSFGAVGYRVVHGGTAFRQPTLLTEAVVAEVDDLKSLAPLHNVTAVAAMTAGLAAIPNLPHVAVFDTAFHATLPEEGFRYPVPESWYRDWGVRRYGFHGISVAWSTERAAALLARPIGELRLVVAHLGSGCSVTAVDGGRSVSTSMGLTPLEGLMMGTRAGSIDPGVLFYVLRNGWLDPDGLAEALDHDSGLVGVSGRTSDARELEALEASGDERATLALALFVRRAAEAIAAAATSLPSLDGIVFTGGIGENSVALRARIVSRLGALGVAPVTKEAVTTDAILGRANGAGKLQGATPAILRIEAREDLIIAREAASIAARMAGGPS